MITYKRLTEADRNKIEALHNAGISPCAIARQLGFHNTTIYRELKRGAYTHMNTELIMSIRYSATKGEAFARFNRTTQGAQLKIGNDHAFAKAIEALIAKERLSPAAALAEIKRRKLQFRTTICVSTLYNYIRSGVLGVDGCSLWRGFRPRRKEQTATKRPFHGRGTSIEHRPQETKKRCTFGDWELDTVIGRREAGETLLVFTERKSRMELIFRSPDKSAKSTVAMLNRLERKLGSFFPKIFKSITNDNGTEFSAFEAMEKSLHGKKNRTHVYYCHPFSSWERGSNENQNGFIRRFIKKGTKIETYTDEYIRHTQNFINNYPRQILNWKTSAEVFESELSKIHPDLPEKFFNFFCKTT